MSNSQGRRSIGRARRAGERVDSGLALHSAVFFFKPARVPQCRKLEIESYLYKQADKKSCRSEYLHVLRTSHTTKYDSRTTRTKKCRRSLKTVDRRTCAGRGNFSPVSVEAADAYAETRGRRDAVTRRGDALSIDVIERGLGSLPRGELRGASAGQSTFTGVDHQPRKNPRRKICLVQIPSRRRRRRRKRRQGPGETRLGRVVLHRSRRRCGCRHLLASQSSCLSTRSFFFMYTRGVSKTPGSRATLSIGSCATSPNDGCADLPMGAALSPKVS